MHIHRSIVFVLTNMKHDMQLTRWTVTNGRKCQAVTAMHFSPEASRTNGRCLLAIAAKDGGLRVIDFDKQELIVSDSDVYIRAQHHHVHVCTCVALLACIANLSPSAL